jgi:type IV secretory pathway component VirB8
MDNNESTSDDYMEIADKVRSGEYFRDAQAMVDLDINDPMSDRYWYIFLTVLSLIIVMISYVAWQEFYPLKPRIPFIFATNNIVDDYPRIRSLLDYHNENPDVALRRYLVQHYVKLREEYDATTFDRNHNAVQSLSTKDVLQEYENYIVPTNPESPISLYQRHTQRKINIVSTEIIENHDKKQGDIGDYSMRVVFEATLKRNDNVSEPTLYEANIAFKYKNIKLNTETGKIEPYGFIITSYHTKSL